MSNPDETLLDTIRKTIPPINQEGWKFIAIFAAVTVLMGIFSTSLLWIGIILTLWCAFFFRDPIRTVPTREGLIVSPADGVIQKITKIIPDPMLHLGSSERTRISIFLNVFDVHVNRIPIGGTVSSLHYHPGTFVNASLDKASEQNERQYITVTHGDKTIGIVQIAGFVARRILCTLTENQAVVTGERLGLIRFGSRVDIYLPENVTPLVIEGQYAIGGETIFADLNGTESVRMGIKI
jgi:phosphatidylserine decarboxylase